MRVLLILPRYELSYESAEFNFGFGYLCAVLKQSGHTVDVLNTEPVTIDINGIHKRIENSECDIICLGGLSIAFNFLESTINFIRKKRPDIPIVLGGGIITAVPDLIFDHLKPDYGILGEGERTIVELLDTLENNKDLSAVNGLIYEYKGHLIKTEARSPIMDLDTIPYPAWDELDIETLIENTAKNQWYSTKGNTGFRRMSVISSRSCPFLCSFCFHPLGNVYRKRSTDSVISEIEILIKKYNINFIRMADELFIFDKQWVRRFCTQLIEKNINISWECNGKVKFGDIETFSLMKEAGCFHISHGFESGNNEILTNLNKKFTVAQARETTRQVRSAGIDTLGGFIIGTPGETEETFKDTVEFIKEMNFPVTWFGFITPFPGTEIYKEAIEKSLIKDEIEFHRQIWNTQSLLVNFTDLSDEELIKLKEKGLESIYQHLIKNSTDSILSSEFLDDNSSKITSRCISCQHIEEFVYSQNNMNINIIGCSNCSNKKLIAPHLIPHMRKRIERFKDKIKLLQEGDKVFCTPIGVHSSRVIDYMDLDNVSLQGFYDSDKTRVKDKFLNFKVFHRSKAAVMDHNPQKILLIGDRRFEKVIYRELIEFGITKDQIVCFYDEY